jgi:hypothetical protein
MFPQGDLPLPIFNFAHEAMILRILIRNPSLNTMQKPWIFYDPGTVDGLRIEPDAPIFPIHS